LEKVYTEAFTRNGDIGLLLKKTDARISPADLEKLENNMLVALVSGNAAIDLLLRNNAGGATGRRNIESKLPYDDVYKRAQLLHSIAQQISNVPESQLSAGKWSISINSMLALISKHDKNGK
jgi:hypothetical protein